MKFGGGKLSHFPWGGYYTLKTCRNFREKCILNSFFCYFLCIYKLNFKILCKYSVSPKALPPSCKDNPKLSPFLFLREFFFFFFDPFSISLVVYIVRWYNFKFSATWVKQVVCTHLFWILTFLMEIILWFRIPTYRVRGLQKAVKIKFFRSDTFLTPLMLVQTAVYSQEDYSGFYFSSHKE